jgi:preprotein translocase subunit SecG
MKEWLLILQIIFGLGMSVTILLQARGTGLGRAWGGSGMAYHSKRGVEKLVFRLTIILAVLFFLNSVLVLVT